MFEVTPETRRLFDDIIAEIDNLVSEVKKYNKEIMVYEDITKLHVVGINNNREPTKPTAPCDFIQNLLSALDSQRKICNNVRLGEIRSDGQGGAV